MIEWKKYDKSNPPPESVKFILYSEQGEIEIGEIVYDDSGCDWIGDQHFQPISDITHYAEINHPETQQEEIKENSIYILHDIGKSELTKEQAKQLLIDHNNGDKLPPKMLEIVLEMLGEGGREWNE